MPRKYLNGPRCLIANSEARYDASSAITKLSSPVIMSSMKEDVLDIVLLQNPAPMSSKSEEKADSVHFSHRSKRLLVIKAILLGKAFRHHSGLVSFKRTI